MTTAKANDKANLKVELLQQVLERLKREHETLSRAANEARETATHAENKQENKYDTRGLEASYLAHGQSKRAAEIQSSIDRLKELRLQSFGEGDRVAAGALLLLEKAGARQSYFLLPYVGGMTVAAAGQEWTVISTVSPLGKELLGREVGEEFRFSGLDCLVVNIN